MASLNLKIERLQLALPPPSPRKLSHTRTAVYSGFERDGANVKMKKFTFLLINDFSTQLTVLLTGDIDGMPRFQSPQSFKQFQTDKRFMLRIVRTACKGIMIYKKNLNGLWSSSPIFANDMAAVSWN